ncbi:hypothetical protein EJ08DRAFT_123975 [Tothia fuscella]|uniref:NEDD8-activating enzyme E1 regulatory subunit n=1 Tax=Tothia fuscella TaxID=1048955 RepID=A0A9P4NUP9_9PEZI|nr:hypothetical protein EJ08DRAFT_123975 [Tothia fuscella]
MASGTTTPPVLHGPTAKEKKYDRQLRLWAASGQAALEEAHLLLVNLGSGVVGVETLKNLVLPGIGQYTILDSATVKEEDLGVNFFLDESSLGNSRGQATCKFLQELNPDVKGHFIAESVEGFISKPQSLKAYSLILVSAPIDPSILSQIQQHATETFVPLFYIHSLGFYAHFSLQLPHTWPIVDTHPDPVSTTDLRLLKPWPELLAFVKGKSAGLDDMNAHDHGHVPYLVLLLYYLEEWKKEHEGKVPSVYKEKNEFRDIVRKGMRSDNAEGGEENFEEAIAAVLKSLNEPTPTSAVKEVFNAEECKNITKDCPNFWIIASAISTFHANTSLLPLPGSLPDMKAQSSDYITLQNLYKSKARADIASVLSTVRSLEKELNRQTSIEESEVEAFCKNAGHIKLIRGRPFHVAKTGEKITWGDRAKTMVNALTDEGSLVLLYIGFLAWDLFCGGDAEKVPGTHDADGDATTLTQTARGIIAKLLTEADKELEEEELETVHEKVGQICQELARAGGAELHNISALTGGLVAQEVIKAITKQYIPVDNTCLFDGVRSVSSVLKI